MIRTVAEVVTAISAIGILLTAVLICSQLKRQQEQLHVQRSQFQTEKKTQLQLTLRNPAMPKRLRIAAVEGLLYMDRSSGRIPDLRWAELSNIRFEHMNFDKVRLEYSDLSNSKFARCSLVHASLCGSDIRGADFLDADLTGVRMKAVTADDTTKFPAGFNKDEALRIPCADEVSLPRQSVSRV